MGPSWQRGVRRHLSLFVSGALVLGTGGLGLLAGHTAGEQARDVHRADRLVLQERLGGLVQQYALLIGVEAVDRVAVGGPWSAQPGDPATVRRLQQLVEASRSLDAGGVLVGPTGTPLASWSARGALPAPEDPGWGPLRAAVRTAAPGVLPVSDLLRAGDRDLLAVGVPASLSNGTRGLFIGLWDPAQGALQQYVTDMRFGSTGQGYVIDGTGRALAAPTAEAVGAPLPYPEVLAGMAAGGDSGLLDTDDVEGGLVTSYAVAGTTGWTALTPQGQDEFEGALTRSSRLAAASVVALVLAAGSALMVLHRKRESALEAVALRDDLTGLYNRRGWFVLAEHELERARRQGTARVLLFVDLDGLKQVNDGLGHREGDRAILDAAQVLRAASRSSDLAGRLGGDEFVLLLGDGDLADVVQRRVVAAVEAHNARSGANFELRLSIGAQAWSPDQGCSLDELVVRADAAMYADKARRPERSVGLLRVPPQQRVSPSAGVGAT